MDVKAILTENIKLNATNKQLMAQVARLQQENEELNKKVEELLQLPSNEFTLDQFRKTYLGTRYSLKTMPKRGGIYAYYNDKEKLLYIGQSKNMGTRLKQHLRNAKVKVNGHDSEFKDDRAWSFHVLEYIDKNDKAKLDEREAYWIAMAKVATSDKRVIDKSKSKKFVEKLKSGKPLNGLTTSISIEQEGGVTNRTRGNNIKM